MATQDNLHVRVELNGTIYEEDLALQTAITADIGGLNHAMAEQPGRFAWWATLEALARGKHEDLVAQLDSLDATLFGEYQAILRTGASKEPTLDAIRSRVHLDARRESLAAAMRQAKVDADLVQAGRRTMEHRKDALTTIASNMRAEMDLRLYIGKSRLPDASSDHVRKNPDTKPRRT